MLKINNFRLNQNRSKRLDLVRQLADKGINDANVLNAFAHLPRELFVTQSFLSRAYDDTALPIDDSQTISQPYTVAFMTSLLKLQAGQKILEIGTGSGFQASILYLLGANVYSIERIENLYNKAKSLLDELGVTVNLRLGDGTIGWRSNAPFDGIIITAAAPEIPINLIAQLKTNGKMIVPVGEKSSQEMFEVIKTDDHNNYTFRKHDRFKFVPLIGKQGWTE
jgi:protein-L-isoaspartate(D-aspartate) O-methyltransferase